MIFFSLKKNGVNVLQRKLSSIFSIQIKYEYFCYLTTEIAEKQQ